MSLKCAPQNRIVNRPRDDGKVSGSGSERKLAAREGPMAVVRFDTHDVIPVDGVDGEAEERRAQTGVNSFEEESV